MIIYTAIFNRYDTLNEFPSQCRKICFTDDRHLTSNNWEIKLVEHESKIYRKIKILPHLFLPPHDKSVWIDGHLLPIRSIEDSIGMFEGYWLMKHPHRNCLYDEGNTCIQLRKDNPKIIQRQLLRYKGEGYPVNNGLCATGVLIRSNTLENQAIDEQWWEEVRVGSVRDQLSFNYIAWKNNLQYFTFPFLEGFKNTRHVKDRRHKRAH